MIRRELIARHFGGLRGAYLSANVFELWLAAAVVIGAIIFFGNPQALQLSVIGRSISWAYLWNGGYLAGGTLILVGLWRPWPRAEVAGLSLMAGAIAVQGIASFTLRGWPTVAGVLLLLGLVGACVTRAVQVYRLTARLAAAGASPDAPLS